MFSAQMQSAGLLVSVPGGSDGDDANENVI